MNVGLHLENLKRKPVPGRGQIEGVSVLFGSKSSDVEPLKIVNVTEEKKIDRSQILNRLRGRDILTVKIEFLPEKSVTEPPKIIDMDEVEVKKEPIKEEKEDKAEPDKPKADKAEPDKPKADKAEPDKPKADKAEPIKETEEPIKEDKAEPDKPKADKAEPKEPKQKKEAQEIDIPEEIKIRIPKKKETNIIKASSYYLSNRRLFIQKINELFSGYQKELKESTANITCESRSSGDGFDLLTHQKIARDYLNLYTPYRGLLLYHGLGAGKTCNSIAISEGMKSKRKVVVMTPASLKMNFFSELKKCGDPVYQKNQYWEFVSIQGQPEYKSILAKALSLPVEFIESAKGAWLVDANKSANFTELNPNDQAAIDKQLNAMIRTKYIDINYNGLNRRIISNLTEGGTINPFDDKVVLIDEAHNFVGRIVNQLKNPNSISYQLYHLLMSAQNARIVLMSGTPIINYPNEIAVLYNILRGYVKTWTFSLQITTKEKVNRDTILKLFDDANFKTYDYVEYSGNKLTITRNPFGFINVKKRGVLRGTKKIGGKGRKRKTEKKQKTPEDLEIKPEESAEMFYRLENTGEFELHVGGADLFEKYNGIRLDETGNITDEDFEKTVIRILTNKKTGIAETIQKSDIKINTYKALPDDPAQFLEKFVEIGNDQMKNENVFKRRILGLTSYFRSAQEQLMPSYVKSVDVKYDLKYENGKVETGVEWKNIHLIDGETPPEEYTVNTKIEANYKGLGKWQDGKITKVVKSENIFHVVRSEMSGYQFDLYEKIRKEENERERNVKKKQRQAAKKENELFTVSSTYRIFSRACCNFAFPDPPGRPVPDKRGNQEIAENQFDVEITPKVDEVADEEDPNLPKTAEEEKEILNYQSRIDAALQMLKDKSSEYLTLEKLETYSPKFKQIVERLTDPAYRGLHLLYSQFRTLEGVGILKLVLEENGFAEFKIVKSDKGVWEINPVENSEGKPRFVLYTGTESSEEKEIIRNIYNSAWDYVPASISDELRRTNENNFYGEIIKIMMITASGAEGINLKNTRYVHIVEPYWHLVRIEQVVGRARRICSHEDLPEEDRNIQVFLYLSVMSVEQKTSDKYIDLRIRDVSKLDDVTPVTTDEALYESSMLKDKINQQILTAMKETAIDCSLYKKNKTSTTENLVCYGADVKVTSNQFSSYPKFERDEEEKEEFVEKEKKLTGLKKIMVDDLAYALDPKTNIVYDYSSYLSSVENKDNAIERVGILKNKSQIEGEPEYFIEYDI